MRIESENPGHLQNIPVVDFDTAPDLTVLCISSSFPHLCGLPVMPEHEIGISSSMGALCSITAMVVLL